jgi:hypothetical protein
MGEVISTHFFSRGEDTEGLRGSDEGGIVEVSAVTREE